jgi:Clp amino terminal domain, pathogenicity island component
VISQASEEARSSGHGWIESEHELLGLLAVQDGIACEVFAELGITINRVRELVSELPGPSRPPVGPDRSPVVEGQLPFSTTVRRVHSRAASQALSVGSQQIGAEHLLLGIAEVHEASARRILEALGADPETVREAVRKRLPPPGPERIANARLRPMRGRLPEVGVPAPVEFRAAADEKLRHVLVVSAGLAMTDGRETFGIGDLLAAWVRDPELAQLLVELGVDLALMRERFGAGPPPGAVAAGA